MNKSKAELVFYMHLKLHENAQTKWIERTILVSKLTANFDLHLKAPEQFSYFQTI